jgi:hypothetical protein
MPVSCADIAPPITRSQRNCAWLNPISRRLVNNRRRSLSSSVRLWS